MEINNQNSISVGAAIGKITGFIATAIVSATAVFLMFFLFASRVNAQSVNQFATPHLACQTYYSQPGFTIIRDLESDCLVRNGDTPAVFIYTHFFDSGSNFVWKLPVPRDDFLVRNA